MMYNNSYKLTEEDSMEYCRRLKVIRCQNKLKQYQVAEALGISRSTYCSYETGRRSIDLDTLVRLSKFYNLSLDIFLEELNIDLVAENDNYEFEGDTRFLSQLSSDEIALIAKYRAMTKEDKKEITDLAKSKVKSKE